MSSNTRRPGHVVACLFHNPEITNLSVFRGTGIGVSSGRCGYKTSRCALYYVRSGTLRIISDIFLKKKIVHFNKITYYSAVVPRETLRISVF